MNKNPVWICIQNLLCYFEITIARLIIKNLAQNFTLCSYGILKTFLVLVYLSPEILRFLEQTRFLLSTVSL